MQRPPARVEEGNDMTETTMAVGSAGGSTVQPSSSPKKSMQAQDNVCEHCGNRYDKAFSVVMDGTPHVFDSFECAIYMLAPRCAHCQCTIIGHGVESQGKYFCCVHCAEEMGIEGLADRTGPHV
jgi:hypothetical protein